MNRDLLTSATSPLAVRANGPGVEPRAAREARVLIVDSQCGDRELTASYLREAGYACQLVEHIEPAFGLLAHEPIDVFAYGVDVLDDSSVACLSRLGKSYPHLAVLITTRCRDAHIAIAALTQGAWGYLVKPLDKEALLVQTARALERQHLLMEHCEHMRTLECRINEQSRALREISEEAIHRLTTASMVHDDETGEHIRRIGLLSRVIAIALDWPRSRVESILLAAPMHDIGKVGIPDAILRKPGKLTPEEYKVMQAHTLIGANILAGSKVPMLQMAEEIARTHHERWDGSGYPYGLAGDAIPISGRIVAAVDVFDALIHDRVYRSAMTEDEATAILDQGTGTHFDPQIIEAFFRALPEIRQTLAAEAATASHRHGHSLATPDRALQVTAEPMVMGMRGLNGRAHTPGNLQQFTHPSLT